MNTPLVTASEMGVLVNILRRELAESSAIRVALEDRCSAAAGLRGTLLKGNAALRLELAQVRAELATYREQEARKIAEWDAWGDQVEADRAAGRNQPAPEPVACCGDGPDVPF